MKTLEEMFGFQERIDAIVAEKDRDIAEKDRNLAEKDRIIKKLIEENQELKAAIG